MNEIKECDQSQKELFFKMKEPSDPRMSGKIAFYALIFIAALVCLVIWVA